MKENITQVVPGSWKDFYLGGLNFCTLLTNEKFTKDMNLLLNPEQNPNARYYGNGKFYEDGKVEKIVNLWGKRAQEDEAARCFLVYSKGEDNPLGFINIGYSSKGLNLLEGGALFQHGTATALQTAALNGIYIEYVEAKRQDPATEEKFKNTEGLLYTLWNDNPLLKAFEDSALTSLASEHGWGMRKYLTTVVNSRFKGENGYLYENIGNNEFIPILNGEEASKARRGFFTSLIQESKETRQSNHLLMW